MSEDETKLNELMLCNKILAVFILFRRQIIGMNSTINHMTGNVNK